MKKMILLLAVFFLAAKFGYTQHVNDTSGKTYYDPEKTKLKEVFMYKEVNIVGYDGSRQIVQTIRRKHGPYFYYYENGKIKISGNYKDDKKEGEWKYYDETGAMVKNERYLSGILKN